MCRGFNNLGGGSGGGDDDSRGGEEANTASRENEEISVHQEYGAGGLNIAGREGGDKGCDAERSDDGTSSRRDEEVEGEQRRKEARASLQGSPAKCDNGAAEGGTCVFFCRGRTGQDVRDFVAYW